MYQRVNKPKAVKAKKKRELKKIQTMIYKTLQMSSDVKRVWCFINEKLIKDLRICIFDWSRTTRI